jgi:predicted signal transduction protein with EAL and GGDEF domain
MLEQVQEIIEHERLWLVFQPIASMRGDANERYEVLLRLRDSEGQEIVPGSVFGVVYNHQLGQMLDRWVIDHALEMLRQRRSNDHAVHQNPAHHHAGSDLERLVAGTAGTNRGRGERIVFEVAEATAERSLRDMFGFLGGIKLLGLRVLPGPFWPRDGFAGLAQEPGRRLRQAGYVLCQQPGQGRQEAGPASRIWWRAWRRWARPPSSAGWKM